MTRRDRLLQQMGINQWQLYRPHVLKGSLQIKVNEQHRLLILTDHNLDLSQPLLNDILLSLEISVLQCLTLTFSQLSYWQVNHSVICWQLGEFPKDVELKDQIFNQIWYSPAWPEFKNSVIAKRQLWQQIQQTKL